MFGPETEAAVAAADRLAGSGEVVRPESIDAALELLDSQSFDAVLLTAPSATDGCLLLQSTDIFAQIPHGVAILDQSLVIRWANKAIATLTGCGETLVGLSFYSAFGTPEILGPDYCPFHTSLGTGAHAQSTLRVGERNYYEVDSTPLTDLESQQGQYLVVFVRDVSHEVLQQQKLNAIYQAGIELGDLAPEEILEMTVDDRIELLKSKIIHFTKDLLEFETVEIRILSSDSNKLEPLLVVGMEEMAANRELFASPEENGVTGFVAATGKSYLCEDTANDPLYLTGAPDARSSLTVPLILHDEILGTFNVESPRTGAFNEHDLQFLELFSREVAVALNTLDLLVVEKMSTATESAELMMREVSNPVDEILHDAAWILERYIGHEPNVCERLQRILKHTRDIKQLIHNAGETMTPKVGSASVPARAHRPKLRGKRVLVVDADHGVRRAAHEMLGRLGCDVETAHNGEEAFLMVRSFHYDVVLADIRLPDMNGYECFCQLREIHEHLPVILMTGFGYDPTHSIVKSRQMGLKSVLYKPFRLDQLISEIEAAVASPSERPEDSLKTQ
ncbi:MAG: two-component system response regulator [Planctomycetaceae bacterium]|nr:two-component system response regulator [Planctomycetaceae bacterium]